jgi:hypothetical protein
MIPGMPGTRAKEYRARAEEARARASELTDSIAIRMMLDTAAVWERMAEYDETYLQRPT